MSNYQGMRALVYARYSTDMQNPKSVEDQYAEIDGFAARNGIKVIRQYNDREKSSSTMFDRPGLDQLLTDIQERRMVADLLLLEHPNRLSRDTVDSLRIRSILEFMKMKIVTVHQGEMDEMKMTFHGMMGREFLKQLKAQVRRGMKGRAREGKVVAGVSYGYKTVPGKRGEREIIPEHAEIVRRIFMEYIAGESPRSIAMKLRAEGVPAPGRTGWNHQNISGGRTNLGRKAGILNNPIYIGQIRYGVTSTVQNPLTGKKVRRWNQDDAVVTEAPHLRIIDDETWEAAQEVMNQRVKISGRPRKPWKRNDSLLAGMCRCPCGANMIVAQRSRSGAGRIKCSDAHQRDLCSHTKSYDLPRLEKAVLDALSEQLADGSNLEAKLEVFLQEYRTTFTTRQREARRTLDDTEERLRKVRATTQRMIALLEDDDADADTVAMVKQRLKDLGQEKAALEERQRIAQQDVNVIALHPTAVTKYREAVRVLQEDLQGKEMTVASKMAFRNLVESITVFQTGNKKPYAFKINGQLGALVGIDLYPQALSAREIVAQNGGPAEKICADNVASAKAG
jgi:site-specific DNA recombinase